MLTITVALVSEVDGHDPGDVARVTAALQRQAIRDFRSVWKVEATVDSFPTLEDVPLGYWPIIIRDDIGFPGAAGIHLDNQGQPFALITMSDSWSLTASHELLEMLADPFGNRLVPGQSPKPGQGRVEFLVEVCDPSEAERVRLHRQRHPDVGLLHAALLRPGRRPGRALQLHGRDHGAADDPEGRLHQLARPRQRPLVAADVVPGSQPKFRDLGHVRRRAARLSLRAWIDSQTQHPGIDDGLKPKEPPLRPRSRRARRPPRRRRRRPARCASRSMRSSPARNDRRRA